MDDIFATHDALAVAELVRSRKIGLRELVDGTIANLRIAFNGSLNAVTDFYDGEIARKSAAAAGDGPFQRIPLRCQTAHAADCAGTPTTLGSKFFARTPVAAQDSAAVACLRRAGLVIVGRTNTSEFGLAPTTEPAFGGTTVNPWRKDLSPGGSSGGSAAVVAARAVPMAHATDGGGSIRIPASLCGSVRVEAVARPHQPGADRRDPRRRGRTALRVDLGARLGGAPRCRGRRRAGRSLSCAADLGHVPRRDQADAWQTARSLHAQAGGRGSARSGAGGAPSSEPRSSSRNSAIRWSRRRPSTTRRRWARPSGA